MVEENFIFLTGLHRSGTSLLHDILRSHEKISGFSGTGVPEDEGQHLQTIYEPAKNFGGPGKFAFNASSYMDESHPLATDANALKLFGEWRKYFDLSCDYLIEKSPPTLIRTRFFQKLFPRSKFIIILRHPLAIAYATRKWSKTSIESLLEHTLLAYEIFFKDVAALRSAYVLKYEEFVEEPQGQISQIYDWLGLDSFKLTNQIFKDVNRKYFDVWKVEKNEFIGQNSRELIFIEKFEERMRKCGYSLKEYDAI